MESTENLHITWADGSSFHCEGILRAEKLLAGEIVEITVAGRPPFQAVITHIDEAPERHEATNAFIRRAMRFHVREIPG